MSPLLTKALLILAAVACFAAAYFMPDQRVVLVAAGVAALGLAAPELGKGAGRGGTGAAVLCLALLSPTFTSCSPAVTQAVVSTAAAIVQEVLLRSQQSSVVLDQVEGTLDQLQVPPNHKARTAVQACRAALSVAVKAVRAGEQTAEAANVAFAGFREQWAVLMAELQALGLSSSGGRLAAQPGMVAIDEPLALQPFEAQ